MPTEEPHCLSAAESERPPIRIRGECKVPTFKTSSSTKKASRTPRSKTRPRNKLSCLKGKVRKKNIRIRNMEDLVKALTKEVRCPEILLDIIRENFMCYTLDTVQCNIKGPQSKTNPEAKEFALTVYFHSPKVYGFIRRHLRMPAPSTLRRWLGSSNCEAGFIEEVFSFIKNKALVDESFRDFGLVFDCMSISKALLFDKNEMKYVGCEETGRILSSESCDSPAKEALVFLIVGLKRKYKCAVGYFLFYSMSTMNLANLIRACLLKLHEAGVRVHTCTFDGESANISAMKALGCSFPHRPFFKIIGIPYEIFTIFDPSRMIESSRNALRQFKIFKSSENSIEFKYIDKLHSLRKEKDIKLMNKLNDRHTFFENRKMNSRISTLTLSASVANALDFLRRDESDFHGSEETANFVRIFDSLFDVFNSRVPCAPNFKAPITDSNWGLIKKNLVLWKNYLKSLTTQQGERLIVSRTFVVGFLSNISALLLLVPRLLEDYNFKYIFTNRFSQCHLDLLFSKIKAQAGWHCPYAIQFKRAFKKLTFRNPHIDYSDGSNTANLDSDEIVEPFANVMIDEEHLDVLVYLLQDKTDWYNEIYFISSFINKKLIKILECPQCQALLVSENLPDFSKYLDLNVDESYLMKPSNDVVKIVRFSTKLVFIDRARDFNKLALNNAIVRKFLGTVFRDHAYDMENHHLNLIKSIADIVIQIKFVKFREYLQLEKTKKVLRSMQLQINDLPMRKID